MSSLILPDWVRHNVEREKAVDEQLELARYWNRLLKEIDEQLSLVWVHEESPPYPGIQPGRWHIKRRVPGSVDIYIPITGPSGEYMEPHSGILEELQRRDLWGREGLHAIRKQQARQALERERNRERQLEEINQEFRERVAAYTRPSILFSGDVRWRNNVKSGGRS
jgi:hypothetical protein